MSIIQEALKKAQGDFTEKDIPKAKHDPVRVSAVKSGSAQPGIQAHARLDHEKTPSVRLPALVSVLMILLLVYGFKVSLQYSRGHGDAAGLNKNAADSAVGKNSKTNPMGALGQFNNPSVMNFMEPHQSALVLSGIMYVEGKPQAIINGQVLEEGDKINNAAVVAIEKDCVLLDLNNTNVRLDLNKQN